LGYIYNSTATARVPVGQVDSKGYIYDSTAAVRVPVGQVDSQGYIYDSTAMARVPVGQIDSQGYIYNSTAATRVPVGQVDSKGYIYDSTSTVRVPIGQIESPNYLEAGAALLLILRPKKGQTAKSSASFDLDEHNSTTSAASYSSQSGNSGFGIIGYAFVALIIALVLIAGIIGVIIGLIMELIGYTSLIVLVAIIWLICKIVSAKTMLRFSSVLMLMIHFALIGMMIVSHIYAITTENLGYEPNYLYGFISICAVLIIAWIVFFIYRKKHPNKKE